MVGLVVRMPPGTQHYSYTVEPAGQSWVLTPPSAWCNISRSAAGTEYSCSMTGAAWIVLNVTQTSRIAGDLAVSGPSTVWLLPYVWACELEVKLTGFIHSCPLPFNPPPWPTWNASFASAGTINLTALPINVTDTPGSIPPATWALLVVDNQGTNETVTAASPVVLSNP